MSVAFRSDNRIGEAKQREVASAITREATTG
jgi:hypothetical protein